MPSRSQQSTLAAVFSPLTVVVPAYNAAPCLLKTLQDISSWLNGEQVRFEIIVVDDASRDATATVAASFGPSVRALRNERNRGKGYTVRRGILAGTGAWRLFLDADHSTHIRTLERCLPFAAAHTPVIIGSRRVQGARIVRRQNPIRQSLGRAFPYLVRAAALPAIRDSQCGFKLFCAEAAEAIFSRQRVERFAFDVELLLLAQKLGYEVAEVPVDWDNPTTSTLRLGSDTVQMMWDLLRSVIRVRWAGAAPPPLSPLLTGGFEDRPIHSGR